MPTQKTIREVMNPETRRHDGRAVQDITDSIRWFNDIQLMRPVIVNAIAANQGAKSAHLQVMGTVFATMLMSESLGMDKYELFKQADNMRKELQSVGNEYEAMLAYCRGELLESKE